MYNVVLVSQKIVDDTRCFFNAVGVCAYCILASVIFLKSFSAHRVHTARVLSVCHKEDEGFHCRWPQQHA